MPHNDGEILIFSNFPAKSHNAALAGKNNPDRTVERFGQLFGSGLLTAIPTVTRMSRSATRLAQCMKRPGEISGASLGKVSQTKKIVQKNFIGSS